MYQVVCTDLLGQTHDVMADEVGLRTIVHGISFTDEKFLLVLNKINKKWELPGGILEKDQENADRLKQSIAYQTGMSIEPGFHLASIIEEDFFDIEENKGFHLTRIFYTVKLLQGGVFQENGNGVDTLAAHFFTLKEVEKFSEKDMKSAYKYMLLKLPH